MRTTIILNTITIMAGLALSCFAHAEPADHQYVPVPTKIVDMTKQRSKQVILVTEESVDALIKVRISSRGGSPKAVVAEGDGVIECRVEELVETIPGKELAAFVSYTNTDDTGHCLVKIISASGRMTTLDLFTPDK